MNTTMNPAIEWKTINDKEYLYFTFEGTLTEENASRGIVTWRELFGSKKGSHELIWDCMNMKGYKPMARSIWQKALKEHKDRIGIIWLITDSKLIQAGAKLMSFFVPYDFKVIKNKSEIEI